MLGLFPFVPFYAFLGIGTELYKNAHHGLSLSSFLAFSSRKYHRENLVSFMLVKVSEWLFGQYRFNLFRPDWTTNGKEVSHPLQDGWSLLCILLSFFGHRRLPTKKCPHWSLLCAFKLSKIESTLSIYFLGLAKNPRDRTTTVYLDTTPHITVQ